MVLGLVVFPNSNLGEFEVLIWEIFKVRFEGLGLPFSCERFKLTNHSQYVLLYFFTHSLRVNLKS